MQQGYWNLLQAQQESASLPADMNRPDSPLRLGVIGCGNVLGAYRLVIDRQRARGAVEVTFACGRETQREAACAALHTTRFTTDAHEVIAAPDVDAVLILTSMPEHARLAQAALEAGKHVLVEKPLATTLAEADALIALAERVKRVFLCAPFTILSPTFQTMARRIRAGDIGKPCSARARYGWAGPDWTDWFYKPGGGCLFDLGVYCLTSLTGLLGPAQRVMAMTGVAIPEREVKGRPVRVEKRFETKPADSFTSAICVEHCARAEQAQTLPNPSIAPNSAGQMG